jgi:peptidyl-prolyl cis-trans isomerase D
MLNIMRKHAGSWMIKVLLFAIVIVFVFWGVGSFRSNNASTVATVNGEAISLAEYRRAYNNLIDQYRQRFGASLNDGMIEMLQLDQQAMDQLIERAIVLQEAEQMGLRVSDAEVAESIVGTPVFQENGSFDNRRYRNLLAQVHLTPEEYEADQKQVLLSQKLTRMIMGAAKVSEAETRQWYEWQNTSVDVDYVLLDPNRYSDVVPSDQAVAAYFDAHKEDYKTEPMIKARYVVFDPADDMDQATVTDDEIAAYYEANISDYQTEKTVEARHILIKAAPDADAQTDAAAKARATEIAAMAKAGKDFAELAKAHSEGPSKNDGGYIGKFQHGQMVKPFADKAFSMKTGEISDPVKTQFGWHVIKVESVEAASTKSLEESKPSIADILKEGKARSMAYDRAEKFYQGTFGKEDLINNAETFGLEVMETGPFSRQGPEELGAQKGAFAGAAFDLPIDEISDIQDIGGQYYLIQVTETIDAEIPALEDVKAAVAADLTAQLKTEKAKAEAEAMLAAVNAGQPLEAVAKSQGVDVKNTGPFKRDATLPDIGPDSTFLQSAFELTPDNDVSAEPLMGSAGYYLLRLKDRQAPDPEKLAAEQERIETMLLQQKQRSVIMDWIEARKNDSQITVEEAFLK